MCLLSQECFNNFSGQGVAIENVLAGVVVSNPVYVVYSIYGTRLREKEGISLQNEGIGKHQQITGHFVENREKKLTSIGLH